MVIYTSDNHDLKICASVGARGIRALVALGFLSDNERLALARKAERRAKLDAFLASRKVQNENCI